MRTADERKDTEVGYNICKGGEGYTGLFTDAMKAAWHAGNKRYWDSQELTPGQVFNRLTVVSKAPLRRGKKLWNCQCECGNTSRVTTSALKSGNIRSCGCLISEAGKQRWAQRELIGQTFGHLTVESEAEHYRSQKQWKCRCVCGRYTTVRTGSLKSGNTQSCGYNHPIKLWLQPL